MIEAFAALNSGDDVYTNQENVDCYHLSLKKVALAMETFSSRASKQRHESSRLQYFCLNAGLSFTLPALVAMSSQAQVATDGLVDAPSVTARASGMSSLPQAQHVPHRFFDKANVTLLTISLLGQTADAVTTQRGLKSGGHEGNPIAGPFVNQGWAGQAGLAVIVNGAEVGVMYLAHRRKFHRAERIIPLIVAFASGFAAYHNAQIQQVSSCTTLERHHETDVA